MKEAIKRRLERLEASGNTLAGEWMIVIYQDGSQRRLFGFEVVSEVLEQGDNIKEIRGGGEVTTLAAVLLTDSGE